MSDKKFAPKKYAREELNKMQSDDDGDEAKPDETESKPKKGDEAAFGKLPSAHGKLSAPPPFHHGHAPSITVAIALPQHGKK